ncbi:hypothetical protein BV898_11963 [Hypsibius exemplaris]|uniref:Ig-like domain-containing protein n=1 Tax=Hypsibius exemplaris TaxID=2072580 RepID=A0A1W0WF71_HYPEX|nr:hypothetical protein BV898_11963 [Hypsibius exemplaris]
MEVDGPRTPHRILLWGSVFLMLSLVIMHSEQARPWRYNLKQEKKNYDDLPFTDRNSPGRFKKGGARIIRSSHWAFEFRLGHKLHFLCVATGRPLPRITWLKDGMELTTRNCKNLWVEETELKGMKNKTRDEEASKNRIQSRMEIDPTTQGDQGIYACRAANINGTDQKTFKAEYIAT